MHESPRSLRWEWIGFGWFMAVAIASLILLVLYVIGLMDADVVGEMLAVGGSLFVGFFVMGVFVGARVVAAPILHGVMMALCSVVAWLVINFLAGALVGEISWWPVDRATIGRVFALQAAAAVLGARIGVRQARAIERQG